MALYDEVTDYFTPQKLLEWTNPETIEPSSVDTDVLQDACDDTEALFAVYAGTTYDNTNRKHLVIAREGVRIQLQKRANPTSTKVAEDFEAWTALCMQFAKTDARNRILPETDGYTDVSSDDNTTRPRFDRAKFKGVRPR